MQSGLPRFLEHAIKRFGFELGFVACQIHCNQTVVLLFRGQPRDLFGQFVAFMPVDRCDQPYRNAKFFSSFSCAGHHPVNHIVKRKAFGAAERHGRETQFHIFDVILCRVFNGFARDTMNHIRRTIKQSQRIELGKEVLKRILFFLLHLHQRAEAQNIGRDGDAVLARNIEHGVQTQCALQMAVQFHLGEGTVIL